MPKKFVPQSRTPRSRREVKPPQQPHIVSFRLSPSEFEKLESHVEATGTNRSDFIRRVVMSAVRQEMSFSDVMPTAVAGIERDVFELRRALAQQAKFIKVLAAASVGKPLAVLCARYEQATSDASGGLGLTATVTGATRAWSYTYNQYGQLLTETTPKQSPTDTLSHTTTYTYYPTTSFSGAVGYTMGDLQSVTNPLGQVTNYTSYDKAGRLLSSTDANGTVTTQTYFPRGWLQTQTVTPVSGSALTTTYAYWPTGLLKTVTMPDASTLNYSYDAAHRLTDVVDGAGNKVHYVLDNVGNRTSEQVSDASGNLASSVARVFDALNRVQSTTGAMH